MIYILAGIAKSGKSLVAKEIVKRKLLPAFSTDFIMMMLHRANKDLNIDIDAEDRVVAKQIQPYVEGMLRTMIENGVSYLIEGVHFNHDFMDRLLKEYPNDIRIVYLGYKDILAVDKGEELYKYQDTSDNNWFLVFEKEEYEELILYLINESKITYDLCNKYHLPYIEVHDISVQIDEVIDTLFGK